MKNKFSVFYRLLCVLLCVSMAFGVFGMISCGDNEEPKNDEPGKKAERVDVLRVTDDVKIGNKLTNDKFQIVNVSSDMVPEGALKSYDEIRGKYALSHFSVGDFVTTEKISDKKPDNAVSDDDNDDIVPADPKKLGYIVISDYESYVENGDYTTAIAKAIEENPGRTIYFPDGNYAISSPIVISTDPEKSVSLRLSHLAVVVAKNWGDDPKVAMVQIGCEEQAEGSEPVSMKDTDFALERSISIIGGCFDAASAASAIEIGGGKDTYIYNVSIKNAYYGIHTRYANNEIGATFVNVDNVNITGYQALDSAGVFVEGTRNTFSNMRIASVHYGVLCSDTGEKNIFRNLHPLGTGSHDRYTVGFWDNSDGNNFDVCYSDQFSSGYLVEEKTRAVINGGFCYWWTDKDNYHVGFESNGKFNSIVISSKTSMGTTATTRAYLKIGAEGGQGVILYPFYSGTSSGLDSMLEKHCKTTIIR